MTNHVKFWSGRDDLAGKVALTFADFRQRYPAVGWIRGDAEASSEALAELNELRKQVAAMEKRRDAARREPPPGTERLAHGDDPVDFTPKFRVQVTLSGAGELADGAHDGQRRDSGRPDVGSPLLDRRSRHV